VEVDPRWGVDEPRVRVWIATGLVWSGRLVLVAGPLVVLVARLTRASWFHAPLDSGSIPSGWFPGPALALFLAWALILPVLVLLCRALSAFVMVMIVGASAGVL